MPVWNVSLEVEIQFGPLLYFRAIEAGVSGAVGSMQEHVLKMNLISFPRDEFFPLLSQLGCSPNFLQLHLFSWDGCTHYDTVQAVSLRMEATELLSEAVMSISVPQSVHHVVEFVALVIVREPLH